MDTPVTQRTARHAEMDAARWMLRGLLATLRSPSTGTDELGVVGEIELDGELYTISRRRPERANSLSAREREIARMVARGYTAGAIAFDLGISTWTVRTYLRRVYTKLDVRSRGAMVARLCGESQAMLRAEGPNRT